jgi:hypothetical protein
MTAQTMRAAGAPQFTIGNAIGTSIAVFGRHVLGFSSISAIMFVPVIIIGVAILFIFGLQGIMSGNYSDAHSGIFVGMLLAFLVYYAAIVVAMAAMAYGTIQDLRGQYTGIGDCLSRAFGSLIPLALAGLAVGFLAMLGTIALIVPGLMIWTAFSVVGPAIVVEGLGTGAGMRRSRELTRGHRWPVFGALILSAIVLNIISYLLSHIVGPIFGHLANGIFSLVFTIVSQAFQGVLVAVIYFQLRADKEGVSIADIAKVFD